MNDTPDEAETDLRAAIDSGDPARIVAAEAEVDRLEAPQTAPSLHSVALWYAEQGFRVFPLSPGTKIPFKGSNGCHGASSNRDVVDGWWTDSPEANIGIATGHLIDVIDIDGIEGQRSRVAHWGDIFERADNDAVAKILTPRSGGMHLWVPATGDGNAAGIVPGIDYRGVGGYVLAPPSVVTEGPNPGTYRFLGTPDLGKLHRPETAA